jgi:hypothetical protein
MLLEFFNVAKLKEGKTDIMTSQMDALLYLLFVNFQVFYCLQSKQHNGRKNVFSIKVVEPFGLYQ